MIGKIIKDNLIEMNLSQKELSILINVSEKHLSRLINNEELLSPEISSRLGKVFGVSDMALYEYQQNYIELKREKTKDEKAIIEFFKTTDKYKGLSNTSFETIYKDYFMSGSIENYKNYLNSTMTTFKKYKDKPLAYLWISLMDRKYGTESSNGDFKSSMKNTIFKNCFDILTTDIAFDIKDKMITSYLDQNGVVLKNGPFIPGSTIYGVSMKRRNQWFIYLSDMGKREHFYFHTLLHELVHIYYPSLDGDTAKAEREIDLKVASMYEDYSNKCKKHHKELEKFYEVLINQHEDEDAWNKLKAVTKKKINFGTYESML